MINTNEIQNLLAGGGTVVGNDGEKIGKFGQVFLDDETGNPEWVTVRTGLFGMSESFIPLEGASVQGDTVTVAYDKQMVKDAPRIDDENGHLSREDEEELYRYYNRSYQQMQDVDAHSRRETDAVLPSDPAGVSEESVGGVAEYTDRDARGDLFDRDTNAGLTDRDASRTTDDSLTRSEEQLRVGTENVESGRVRLRKYVVTENVTTTVPVSREEVRVEREPITDADATGAVIGDDLSEEEVEVTLHEERPVVDKETVPVERVRLDKETVTDEEQVSEQVRKERIETEGADTNGTDTDTGKFGDRRDR